MSRARRHFSAEQKAQVVRRHLADKEPVSKLADELQIQPSLIHLWVNQVLTQAGTSVLGQANQLPQSAFSLIGGGR